MKHIKAAAQLSKDKLTVHLTITNQTHRLKDFGNVVLNERGATGFMFKGVLLSSWGGVRFYAQRLWLAHPDVISLSVQGSLKDRDSEVAVIPIEHWPKVKAAIEAYNEHFKEYNYEATHKNHR